MQPVVDRVIVQQLDGYAQSQMGGGLQPVFSNNKLTDGMDCAHPEFYPWIKMDLMDYFREFFKSKANALVLIGEPGTGKSTLIRTVIRELNVRAMLAYKQDVITSSEFVGACRDFLNRSNYDPENDITKQTQAIVIEDADLIMRRRVDGNTQMAELLNATSGITSNIRHKFIMSTNLKTIDDIDPALLRPGRCFDILCFRSLSADEATLVRQVRGLEPREFSKANRYKLAEVLNDVITQHQVEPIVKPRFGF
jgi:ABC-type dipeptide/oligopeptide/nickel transport system ATPase component